MCRFLLSRRWIVAGLVVLFAVIVMVMLGLWQLRRHDDVRTQNAMVRARLAIPAEPLERVLSAGADARNAVYRRVEASGQYDEAAQIVLNNRSNDGRPGNHLLTPLVTDDGHAIVVDRGWVPLDPSPGERKRSRPPSGVVRIIGVLFASERKGALGPTIPPEGRATAVPRVDVARISKQLAYPTYPLYLRLGSQTPPQAGALPDPPGPPALDAGPHLSYAGQWFIFAALALATYGALARREARRRAAARAGLVSLG